MPDYVYQNKSRSEHTINTLEHKQVLKDNRVANCPGKLFDGRTKQLKQAAQHSCLPVNHGSQGRAQFLHAGPDQAPIQLKPYRIVDGNPRTGQVEVTSSQTEIKLSGSVTTRSTGVKQAINGGVLLHEYKMPANRAQAPVPVPIHQVPDAMRVHNLHADPRGLKLGQLITYHLGLEARDRNIPYVIAMDITAARGPFYTPLGFTDYNVQQPYQKLLDEKNAIDQFIQTKIHLIQDDQLQVFIQRKTELVDLLAESNMIIPTATLIANSHAAWGQIWSPDRTEEDARKARSLEHSYRF